MLSYTEENYLKTIYHLSGGGANAVLTSEIAERLNTKAASVTDMIKKLSTKKLIAYEKYHGVKITKQGKADALQVVRKHRLWETFLVRKLEFAWDEVHEIAEQLEHIHSPLLMEKLDEFLDFPSRDPHGHPIPDKHGKILSVDHVSLTTCAGRKNVTVQSVKNGSPSFLQYLNRVGIQIGTRLTILEQIEFDGSLEVLIDDKTNAFVSREAAENILVTETL
jgi:DtxR family transcriptional regulator, Mn-dependent transcriptional regulator